MKKTIILLSILFISFFGYAQHVDTVISTPIYKSYFDKSYKEPLYVSYTIFNAGGKESRAGMTFKSVKDLTATAADYSHSGYDEGHLADACDFSNDKVNEESTFRFFNCVPQTPNLNRGIWKHYETLIRNESQTDTLLVICGGYNFTLIDKLYVPSVCFKVVQNMRTKEITHCTVFTNKMQGNNVQDISLVDLLKRSGYAINLLLRK